MAGKPNKLAGKRRGFGSWESVPYRGDEHGNRGRDLIHAGADVLGIAGFGWFSASDSGNQCLIDDRDMPLLTVEFKEDGPCAIGMRIAGSEEPSLMNCSLTQHDPH